MAFELELPALYVDAVLMDPTPVRPALINRDPELRVTMDAITALIEALKTGGPYAMAAIFIAGWWLERRDRREHEQHVRAVHQKTVELVEETTRTVGRMEAAVTALTDAIRSMNGRLR